MLLSIVTDKTDGRCAVTVNSKKRITNDRYNSKCDRIVIQPIKETGQAIREAAAASGQSLQGYILQAISERMERESSHSAPL